MPKKNDALQAQLNTARRQQILDAAIKIFAEKGFHRSTIKDVAQAAGVADGTIYLYFENKTALMLGLLDCMHDSEEREKSFSQAAVTPENLRGFMEQYLRHRLTVIKTDNLALFRVVVSEVMVNKELRELYYQRLIAPTFAKVEGYFQQLADANLIKKDNVGLTMRSISALTLGLILELILGDETLDSRWDDLPAFLTNMIMDGIGVE
jgi:AcrR family transcriptional regulator